MKKHKTNIENIARGAGRLVGLGEDPRLATWTWTPEPAPNSVQVQTLTPSLLLLLIGFKRGMPWRLLAFDSQWWVIEMKWPA